MKVETGQKSTNVVNHPLLGLCSLTRSLNLKSNLFGLKIKSLISDECISDPFKSI
ncbi:hypothetical protein HanRHA438_Chr16g0764701 [Helianthus annuus]|nr:hypothetical protein HanRHA438_Chr16g0764701 [Helianthus annuus]